jgi:hypothetical protein
LCIVGQIYRCFRKKNVSASARLGVFLFSNGAVVSYLDESNILALLAEALTADVQAVLADQTGCVGADSAIGEHGVSTDSLFV